MVPGLLWGKASVGQYCLHSESLLIMIPSFWCFFGSVAPKAVVPKFYYPGTPQLSRRPMAISPICSQEKTSAQIGGKDYTGWVCWPERWDLASCQLQAGTGHCVVLNCDLVIHRRLCTSQRAGVVEVDLLPSLSLLTVLWCKQELTSQFYRWALWCPEKCGELVKVTW